jgi:hypothetical protein
VYDGLVAGEILYRQKLITIPRPVFIVLYNGIEPFPERKVMWLSEAFEKLGLKGKAPLDLKVTVLNINVGFNKALMRRNKMLSDYSTFIQMVRDQERVYGNLARGIKAAVAYCLKHDILKSFLEKYSTEVFDMLEGE